VRALDLRLGQLGGQAEVIGALAAASGARAPEAG
jgi:hypothetical protein